MFGTACEMKDNVKNMIKKLLVEFMQSILNGTVQSRTKGNIIFDVCTPGKTACCARTMCVYNECSLQYELGNYLRCRLPADCRVEFERNSLGHFGIPTQNKSEIDIVIYRERDSQVIEKICAIELKFPRNRQYPEQMYAFVCDIAFLEELRQGGFSSAFAITLVDESGFYNSNLSTNHIYQYFRSSTPISGRISKPTGVGKGTAFINVFGSYTVNWQTRQTKTLAYYMLDI